MLKPLVYLPLHAYWISFLFQIGSFFMINLCLVVIATQFSETKKRETERMMQERKRFQSSSTLASIGEPGGCYDEILKYIAHLYRRTKRWSQRLIRQRQNRHQQKVTPEHVITLQCKHNKKPRDKYCHGCNNSHQAYHIHGDASPCAPRASPEVSDIDSANSPCRPNQLVIRTNSLNPSEISELDGVPETSVTFQVPSQLNSPVKYIGNQLGGESTCNHCGRPDSTNVAAVEDGDKHSQQGTACDNVTGRIFIYLLYLLFQYGSLIEDPL